MRIPSRAYHLRSAQWRGVSLLTRRVKSHTHCVSCKPLYIYQIHLGPAPAIEPGMKNELSKMTKMAAILAFASLEAYGEERTKGDRIVISKTDRKLVLFQGERVLKVYDIAVGKTSTPTPEGEFRVVNRMPNPTWY